MGNGVRATIIGMLGMSATAGEGAPDYVPKKKQTGKMLLVVLVAVAVVVAAVGVYYIANPGQAPGGGGGGGSSGKTSITVWQAFSTTEFPAFLSIRNAFMQQNPNITVNWVNQTTPSPSTLQPAALAGTAPNIIIGTSDFEGSSLYYYNFTLNLKNYVNSSAFSIYSPTALADVTYNGTDIYAFPININGVSMIYNKKLIPTAPQTTDQMIQMAKNITVISGGRYTTSGIIAGDQSDSGYRFVAWQAGFGGKLFASNGAPTINTGATVAAMGFLNNLTTVYQVSPPGMTTQATWISLFQTGQVGIIFDGPWDITSYVSALGANNVGVAPMPTVSQTGLRPLPFLGSIAVSVLNQKASSASSAQINASVKFAQYLASNASEVKFWNSAGDFPATTGGLKYVMSLNVSWANGFAEQFLKYSQQFFNTPQMAYYWTPFGTYYSAFISGSSTAAQAASSIQNSIVSSMQQYHIPPYVVVSSSPLVQFMHFDTAATEMSMAVQTGIRY